MPNYKLYITQDGGFNYFSLVDMEKAEKYPLNWICNFSFYSKKCNFCKLFGEKSQEVALQLLQEALQDPKYSNNKAIKAEIEKRIKRLTKPKPKRNCLACGVEFELTRNQFQKYCTPCREKLFAPITKTCKKCGKNYTTKYFKTLVCDDCRSQIKLEKNTHYVPKHQLFLPKNVRKNDVVREVFS